MARRSASAGQCTPTIAHFKLGVGAHSPPHTIRAKSMSVWAPLEVLMKGQNSNSDDEILFWFRRNVKSYYTLRIY